MNKIRIYTVSGCHYCVELKTMLINENIEFIEVNVSLPENKEEFQKLHDVTKSDDVPIIKVGNRILVPETSFQTISEAYELTKKFMI